MLEATRPQVPLRNGFLLDDTSMLPPGYTLATSDADVLSLLCPEGTTVAMFSARGVSEEGILEAARQDSGRATILGSLRRIAQRTA